MAVKISELPAGAALGGTEKIPAVQSGVTVYSLVSQIGTYVRALFTTTPATIAEGGTNAATAAAARTSLDVAQATNSLTEDTAPDKIADFLSAYDASAAAARKFRLITAVARSMPWGQGLLVNGKISATVAATALTLAVKGDDGNDPSATNPVYALFRKASLTDAGFDIVPITAALSVVVSSGSTLGHASAIAQHVFVYLINNAGAAEVAVSNLPPDYPGVFGKARLVSTTAEGGAGGADSATGVYSTTARSNVPWICVAKALGTQTTAGTWAAAMTQVDAAPFVIPSCEFLATLGSNFTVPTGAWTRVGCGTEVFDPDSTYDAATNFRHQPNVAGTYTYEVQNAFENCGDTVQIGAALFKNTSSQLASQAPTFSGTSALQGAQTGVSVFMNGTTDYMEGFAYQSSGVDKLVLSTSSYTMFRGGRIQQ